MYTSLRPGTAAPTRTCVPGESFLPGWTAKELANGEGSKKACAGDAPDIMVPESSTGPPPTPSAWVPPTLPGRPENPESDQSLIIRQTGHVTFQNDAESHRATCPKSQQPEMPPLPGTARGGVRRRRAAGDPTVSETHNCGVSALCDPDCACPRDHPARAPCCMSIFHERPLQQGKRAFADIRFVAASLMAVSSFLVTETGASSLRLSEAFLVPPGGKVPPRAGNVLAQNAGMEPRTWGRAGAARAARRSFGVLGMQSMVNGGFRWSAPRVEPKWGPVSKGGRSGVPTWASTITSESMTMGDDGFGFPEGQTVFVSECELPTDRGSFRMRCGPNTRIPRGDSIFGMRLCGLSDPASEPFVVRRQIIPLSGRQSCDPGWRTSA